MTLLYAITITVLATAAFINAAALGEQYALKRATRKSVVYRVGIFAVDICLILLVSNAY